MNNGTRRGAPLLVRDRKFKVASFDGGIGDGRAIQQAIFDAKAIGGGDISVPANQFMVPEGGIIIDSPNITVNGAGEEATKLICPKNATYSALTMSGVSATPTLIRYQRVTGLSIVSSAPASSGTTPGVTVQNGVFQSLENVQIGDFQTQLYLLGTVHPRFNKMFMYTYATTTLGIGVKVDGATQNQSLLLNDVAVDNTAFAGTTSYGWFISGLHLADFFIDHCEADGSQFGLWFDGSTATGQIYDCLDITIDHLKTDQCKYGIYLSGIPVSAGEVSILHHWHAGSTSSSIGLTLDNASGVTAHKGDYFTAQGTGGEAILLANGSTLNSITDNVSKGRFSNHIECNASSWNTIDGNNMLQTVTNGATGVLVNGTSANNTVSNNKVKGISGTSVLTYGIFCDTSTTNTIGLGNQIDTATVTTPHVATSTTGNIFSANKGIASYGEGQLLKTTSYGPASLTTYTVAATTLTALDTTNLTIAITVPANGIVDVVVNFYGLATQTSTVCELFLGLLNHSGGALVGLPQLVVESTSATLTTASGMWCVKFHLTGLTPGALTLDLAAGRTNATGCAAFIYASGISSTTVATLAAGIGPVTMQAFGSQ